MRAKIVILLGIGIVVIVAVVLLRAHTVWYKPLFPTGAIAYVKGNGGITKISLPNGKWTQITPEFSGYDMVYGEAGKQFWTESGKYVTIKNLMNGTVQNESVARSNVFAVLHTNATWIFAASDECGLPPC